MPRLYHIVAINERTGRYQRQTSYPMDHQHCMTMKSKMSRPHEDIRIQLVEAKKKPKLEGHTRELASKYIAEEMHTHKYPRAQAIAIGISRAKRATRDTKTTTRLRHLLSKY